jgi:hypothetical protein
MILLAYAARHSKSSYDLIGFELALALAFESDDSTFHCSSLDTDTHPA